ncbi:YtxH domain-containing protein [Paenibacillus sepulcri]
MENTVTKQTGGSLVKGILIGGAVGAAAAVLLTPKTGKDMRETIRRKSSEISGAARDHAVNIAGATRDTAVSLAEAARDRATALADQAKDKASDVTMRVNELGKTTADKVANAAESTANVFQSMKKEEEGAKPNGTTTGPNGAAQDRSQP